MSDYELIRLSANDWYSFAAKDIDFAGHTGLIGRSGAGKSATQDAILTVLVGANENYLALNASASPTGKSSDRNLQGYCLGQFYDVDEGAFQRKAAETMLVLTFRHRMTGEHVAAGVTMAARDDRPGVQHGIQFVVRGLDFRFSDFMETGGDIRYLREQTDILGDLQRRFGADFEVALNKIKFVELLLATMNPRRTPNPQRFMRAVSQCRHLKEIGDPTKFVRDFVLDRLPIDVSKIRESLGAWRALEQEAAEIEEKIELYRLASNRYTLAVREAAADMVDEYREADIQARLTEARIAGDQAEADRLQQEAAKCEADRKAAVAAHEAAFEELSVLRAQLEGTGATDETGRVRRDLNDVLRSIRDSGNLLVALAKPLSEMSVPVDDDVLAGLGRDAVPALRDGMKASAEIKAMLSRDTERLMSGLADGSFARATAQVARAASHADAVERRYASVLSSTGTLQGKRDELDKQVKALAAGQTYVPAYTEGLGDLLRAAGIPFTILSDELTVTDPEWALAIAMVLGDEQTAIVVPASRVKDALAVQRRAPDHLSQARVLLTDRLDRARAEILRGSLAECLSTDNNTIRQYIAVRLGNVMRARDEGELMAHRVAITPDGLMVGGYSSRKHAARKVFIGQTKGTFRLDEMRHELREAEADLAQARLEAQVLGQLSRALGGIASVERDKLDETVDGLVAAGKKSAALAARLGELGGDNATAKTLEEATAKAKAAKDEAERLERVANHARELALRSGYGVETKAQALAGLRDKASGLLARLEAREFADTAALCDLDLTRYRDENGYSGWLDDTVALASSPEELVRLLEAQAKDLAERRQKHLAKKADNARFASYGWNNVVQRFADEQPPEEAGVAPTDHVEFLGYLRARQQRLVDDVLLPFKKQVEEARGNMETSLVEDLLAKIHANIERARGQMDELNRLLRKTSYTGGSTYSFARGESPEHADILKLIRAVNANPQKALLDIARDLDKSENAKQHKSAFDIIERMLETGDDIDRIADYRQYHTYRIEVTSDGAEEARDFSAIVGKLSGGEREAPYYLAIAATMRSVYHPGADGGDEGMAPVILDEAFAKLDIENTKKLIEHFDSMGLQLIIAAPEDKLTTISATADTVLMIHRRERSPKVTVSVNRYSEKFRQELADRTPVYMAAE